MNHLSGLGRVGKCQIFYTDQILQIRFYTDISVISVTFSNSVSELIHTLHLGPSEAGNLPDIGGEAVVGVLGHADHVRHSIDGEVDRIHRISHLCCVW